MPLYVYKCPAGHETERFVVLIKDTPKDVECQWCGATSQRTISAPNFKMAGEVKSPDTAKQAWEGVPGMEEGSDMVERFKFKKYGPKMRVDLGA